MEFYQVKFPVHDEKDVYDMGLEHGKMLARRVSSPVIWRDLVYDEEEAMDLFLEWCREKEDQRRRKPGFKYVENRIRGVADSVEEGDNDFQSLMEDYGEAMFDGFMSEWKSRSPLIDIRYAEDRFESYLNEQQEVDVHGYRFGAGTILRHMDEIGFREEMLTYYDDIGWDVV